MRWIGCGFCAERLLLLEYYGGRLPAHRAGMKGVGGAVRDGQGSRPFRGKCQTWLIRRMRLPAGTDGNLPSLELMAGLRKIY